MKVLVVVDMQNDFIDGALGTAEAVAIVDNVAAKIAEARAEGTIVWFTRDTHEANYLETQEGRRLPVEHCIRGTAGWEISPKLDVADSVVIDKPTFGSLELAGRLLELDGLLAMEPVGVQSVELIGLCTDICVISNAMLVKAALPEIPVIVDAKCCAGVTPASHLNALSAMKMCQIEIAE